MEEGTRERERERERCYFISREALDLFALSLVGSVPMMTRSGGMEDDGGTNGVTDLPLLKGWAKSSRQERFDGCCCLTPAILRVDSVQRGVRLKVMVVVEKEMSCCP